MKSTHKTQGFTLVELLIVIVVIAILAAITLVAYNGVQNRARASTTKADVSNVNKVLNAQYISNDNSIAIEDSAVLAKVKNDLGPISSKTTWSSVDPSGKSTSTAKGNYYAYAYESVGGWGGFDLYFYDYEDSGWKKAAWNWDTDHIINEPYIGDGQLTHPQGGGLCNTNTVEECSYIPQ